MKNWNDSLHSAYMMVGHVVCWIIRCGSVIRDWVDPPESDSILFVAHPDDDALFFHKYISAEKPYVVLLFTGWSLKRLPDFFKAMKYYHVRCRAYSEVSSGAYYDAQRREKTQKYVQNCLKIGKFSKVLTHNANGEYGHDTHRLVHEVVVASCRDNHEIYCPVDKTEIEKYPLSQEELKNKEYVFSNIYRSESWVMTDKDAGTPVWFYNERLEKAKD